MTQSEEEYYSPHTEAREVQLLRDVIKELRADLAAAKERERRAFEAGALAYYSHWSWQEEKTTEFNPEQAWADYEKTRK
jgi:hypothetical protein